MVTKEAQNQDKRGLKGGIVRYKQGNKMLIKEV